MEIQLPGLSIQHQPRSPTQIISTLLFQVELQTENNMSSLQPSHLPSEPIATKETTTVDSCRLLEIVTIRMIKLFSKNHSMKSTVQHSKKAQLTVSWTMNWNTPFASKTQERRLHKTSTSSIRSIRN